MCTLVLNNNIYVLLQSKLQSRSKFKYLVSIIQVVFNVTH